MFERKLMKLLEESERIRKQAVENKSASYSDDVFYNLSNFILKGLNSPLLKNKNARIIADHFDEILPYIVMSNVDVLLLNTSLLIDQPSFKANFITGLKKYPYKNDIDQLFYNIWVSLGDTQNKFDLFMDDDILKALSTIDLSRTFYLDTLNRLNKDSQKNFLILLVKNKCDIPYSAIEYKNDNKQIIYEYLTLFIENAQNLYALLNFVKDNPDAFSKVKDYIDNNEEKALNSIFCETDRLVKIKEPTLKEIIKLMILDVMKNENVGFSDITYNGGSYSRILLIGDKVIKLGDRVTKSFPNNPYIVVPLLRKEFEFNNEKFFVEVTERVDTSKKPSKEELYQLFKNLRDLGLKWTDIKETNVGRLNKKNIIHWRDGLYPTEEVLGLQSNRGTAVLEQGDLVILDADFIYDENDSNINYSNSKYLYDEFENRYQEEKRRLKKQDDNAKVTMPIETNYDISKPNKIHR